jgi:hypothetical protein
MTSEKDCKYVSSRGLLTSCDIHSYTPISSIPQLINYNKNMNSQEDGSTIYVCNTAIRTFLNNISDIKYRFVLVSGDSDTTVPYDIFTSSDEFIKFIDCDKIIHWYSQNCIIDHPKITRIPIGLDYHTLSQCNYKWGPQKSPINQEYELTNIKNNSKPFWQRKIKCYSNFHFSFYKFGQDRIDAMNKIPKNLMFYEEKEVPRLESWERQSEYSFVISPHGNGLDCHRTWEALILGCIVIVKTSGLDPLYNDLPVLIVNDWQDVNKNLLEDTIDNFKEKQFNYSKISLDFWMNKIKTHKTI